MNKICLLFIASLCLFGCNSHSGKVNISGEIKGLGNETIYLYGTNELSDLMDTIYVKEDKFSHTLSIDTLTSAMLFLNSQTECPLFLAKGDKIEIKGDRKHLNLLEVTGNRFNEEITNFQQSINSKERLSEKMLENKAEEFIRQHHTSIVSIYLLKKYFVQKATPDFSKIKQLIALMNGQLQDDPYIDQLSKFIEQYENVGIGKPAPFFSINSVSGKRISLSDIKDKYILLNFWASWSDSCKKESRELRKIHQIYGKKANFTMLGISLDIDKQSWKQTVKNDTLNWQQLCDFSGWGSSVIKQYSIQSLPSYYLIAPDGKIVAREQNCEALKRKIQEIVK